MATCINRRAAFLLAFIPVVFGCSPEAWTEPTLESKTHYAKVVIIGNVTKILDKDPADMLGETYGAEVKVQCAYKGGILPGFITIGGAGFIHGHCDKKDVELATRYILFLDEKQEGQDYYMQSGAAAPYYKDRELVKLCGLSMEYPQANGFPLKRRSCLDAVPQSSCKRYEEPKDVSGRKPVLDVKTGAVGAGEGTTKKPDNSAGTIAASIGLLLASISLIFM